MKRESQAKSVEQPVPDFVSEMAQKLNQAYQELEIKYNTLNKRLEETNLRLKQSLAEKENLSSFFNNILESLTSGVLVVDLEGRITLFNKAAEEITCYRASEVLGKPYLEIIGKNLDRELTALQTLKTKVPHINEEKEVINRNGLKVPLGFSTAPLLDSAGTLLGVVEVFFDLSQIKRLEEEISRVKTLAALGEMAATVAHEVRNPLGGITGFADLLSKEMADNDSRKHYVRKIIEGVENLNRIVKSLLNYTKMIKVTPQEVYLQKFLDEVLNFYQMDLGRGKKNITILREYPDSELKAKIDPQHFRQVIMNLLQNATQSITGAGKIRVALDHTKDKLSRGDKLFLKISDNGCGMSPEVLDKVFTPFFTTKEGGTGLGLATIKKIVEAHQGEIKVNSQLGKGTQVVIGLPIA